MRARNITMTTRPEAASQMKGTKAGKRLWSFSTRAIARRRRQAAYHEAGHAVACLHVGHPPPIVEIGPHGGGFTHYHEYNVTKGDAGDRWAGLVVLFAGSYAEALATRRPLDRVLFYSGKLDLQVASPTVQWLVDNGHASDRIAVLAHTNNEVLWFLFVRWREIDRVATELLASNRLSPRQLVVTAKMGAGETGVQK